MLIRFLVRNFRSIDNEVELSMIPGRVRKHPQHIVKDANPSGYDLLKTSVLWGANAAGKSNIIEAIRFAQQLIVRGTRPNQKIHVERFRLDEKALTQPARFEFEIKVHDKAYAYGFEVTPEAIQNEWLYEIAKTKESRRLFDRTTENDQTQVEFDPKSLGANKEDSQFVQFVARGTRANQLFLTECSERNVRYFSDVMAWFQKVLLILPPPSVPASPMEIHLGGDEQLASNLVSILKGFNIDISGIQLERIDDNENPNDSTRLKELFDKMPGESGQIILGNNRGRFVIRRDKEGFVSLFKVITTHRANNNSDVQFEFGEESDGTIRLIDLLSGFIASLQDERVFVVDELDRSLHPKLSYNFLDFFLKTTKGFPNQLIVTTHETTLLNLELLRRDEIWFVEKNKKGSTELYSLEEFTPRHDKDIRRSYLQGRYGAIPIVRKISDLGWS